MNFCFRVLLGGLFLLGNSFATANADLITTGQTVTGTTFSIANPSTGIVGGQATKSTSGTDLLLIVNSTPSPIDWFVTWNGINQLTSSFNYVQIDFAAAPGAVTGNFGNFWTDTDSTIGGPNNSFTSQGTVTPSTSNPFSVVIDLINPGGTTGAKGWGPGSVGSFRIDPFEAAGNGGVTFTITGVTFGSDLTAIPEPGSLSIFGIAAVGMLIRRSRIRTA